VGSHKEKPLGGLEVVGMGPAASFASDFGIENTSTWYTICLICVIQSLVNLSKGTADIFYCL
jgi:hypothetical protein